MVINNLKLGVATGGDVLFDGIGTVVVVVFSGLKGQSRLRINVIFSPGMREFHL
ncbi:MAG: hypothetical protein ACFFCZ_12725 [Promethearchaeota archaeon]